MQNKKPIVVVLGTGGTIAGVAASADDSVGYRVAQIGIAQLVGELPAFATVPIEVEQVAQIDSKDMGFTVWRALAHAVSRHLARAEVGACVIAHGTDTLEETAYFLHRLLAPTKPVVLVAAMRPANSLQTDGPQNLLDAMVVAREPGAHGVVAVLAGKVHSALDLRKVHAYRLDAFASGDAGVIGHVEQGRLRRHREWPGGAVIGDPCREWKGVARDLAGRLAQLPRDAADWPVVEIVFSHVEARGLVVEAMCDAGVHGVVVAGTGNGSLHHTLESALIEAQSMGVAVLRCTRCGDGTVTEKGGMLPAAELPSAGALTPVQARVELILQLLARRPA